jgi:hypothetical protein
MEYEEFNAPDVSQARLHDCTQPKGRVVGEGVHQGQPQNI